MPDPHASTYTWRSFVAGVLAIAAGHCALALVGISFALLGSNVSPYWPAAGFALAVLWRWGPRWWPGVLLGAFAVNAVFSSTGALSSAVIASGSTLAAVLGAGALRRLAASPTLKRPADPVLLLLVASASTLCAAVVGASTVTWEGLVGETPWHQVVWTWWTGDLTGAVSTAGLISAASLTDVRRWRPGEALGLLGVLAGTCVIAAIASPTGQSGLSPWAFVLFPPLLWSAVRLGSFATAVLLAATAMGMAFLTASGHGPFADFSTGNRTHLPYQIFIIALSGTALVIAAFARSQQLARAELAASESRYRLVADNASDLVCMHALDGRYDWVSPSARSLTGWTPEQLIGCDPCTFLHPDDGEQLRQAIATLPQDGPARNGSRIAYRLRRPDGSYVWLESALRVVSAADGRAIALQSASRDISQRRADEARLAEVQRAAALAERMASLGTLAGGVAHEFNNLNAVVMGNVELALRRSDLQPEVRRRLDHIRDAVEREKGIVEALLAFSRSERGPRDIVDIGRVANTTLALARRTLRQRRVNLSVELTHEPMPANIPTGSLGQVLLNILLNACDAIDRRDDPRIWVTLRRQGGRGVLSVRDNGIGIEPALHARIFEPFFSTKGEHASAGHGQPWLRGSGLGLSVCQTLVEQMHGSITVDSQPGHGATFTIELPLADVPRPLTARTPLSAPCARVLVADSASGSRGQLCEQLTAAGHIVIASSDPSDAIARLTSDDIDVVLLSWSFPGDAVLEHIELHPERRWPPIIVLGPTPAPDLARWRHEIAGLLPAACTPDALRDAITRVLNGQRDA